MAAGQKKTSANFMQPGAAHGTAFRRSPALCKADGFMIETVQSRRIVGMGAADTIAEALENTGESITILKWTVYYKAPVFLLKYGGFSDF